MNRTKPLIHSLLDATFPLIAGCYSVSSADYVPPQSHLCSVGCAGVLTTVTLDASPTKPGTVLLVAGDQPILRQPVAANDQVSAQIQNPLLGDCQIALNVNGNTVRQAHSKQGAYRLYFVPD